MIFSLNQFSMQTDLPLDFLDVVEIVEIQILDWSPEKQCPDVVFPQFLASTSVSPSYSFCWAILPPRTAESTVRSRVFWRFSMSLKERRFDLDLSSFLTVNSKWWNNGFYLYPHQHQSPGCSHDCQSTRAAVSRDSHHKILTWWELCSLRFACCCWMLPSKELQDLRQLRWRWRRHGTGNCQGNWSACAPRSGNFRNWARNLCFESGQPFGQTSHSSEWKRTGYFLLPQNEIEVAEVWKQDKLVRIRLGKRENGTSNNDMSSEMEMNADEHLTQTPLHLEPMCSHTGRNVRLMRCGACTKKSVRLRASGWAFCLQFDRTLNVGLSRTALLKTSVFCPTRNFGQFGPSPGHSFDLPKCQ